MSVVVVGAGVAGLAAGLALARDGNDVTLVERDGFPDDGAWTPSPYEARPGCPQLSHGHAFLARGYALLERHAPDVLSALVDAGGNVTDANLLLPPEHQDDELRTVATRRAIIDEVLLQAVRREPGIRLESGTVAGVVAGPIRDGIPSVVGVETTNGRVFRAELVVDAAGRRSPMREYLEAIDAHPPEERSNPCGILAYGRYFETLHRAPTPPKISPLILRGSLGYTTWGVYWQDGPIITVGFSPSSDDRDLRALRSEEAFMAACRAIPQLAPFVDGSFATPVSDVLSLGGLQNVRRKYVVDGRPVARGFVAIGDGVCHTNPVPAYGMSMALDQAFRLPGFYRTAVEGIAVPLEESVGEELDERYEHVSAFDTVKSAMARGNRPDLKTDVEFLIDTGAMLVAAKDPSVLRRYLRRAFALDPPGAMSRDADLVEASRAAIMSSGILEKAPNPERSEFLRIIAEADAPVS